ncbi:MAG: putative rane protein [Hydrocarboniphaga sp.]|uniref:cation transporter n=1 Tax=Hydrocarboniphaga sp. TaxID=2033016 RepID=UPI00262FE6B0|nr:cation transporter [Hydrocarboniphaga sp.]MDB5968897.1 putative rane protein [Hydrocarboniphaga sp.]
MSAHCHDCGSARQAQPVSPRYRRVLWLALVINLTMFGVELVAGWGAGSVSLLADAVDFFGDAANYGLSLLALSLLPVWRSRTALIKAVSMGLYGGFVLAQALRAGMAGVVPSAATMGIVAAVALLANFSVAAMLYAFRDGDANMRAVWLCSRNDALGNVAVLVAAFGVFGTSTGYPDTAVAVVMAVLGLSAAVSVSRQALAELRMQKPQARPRLRVD